MAPCLAEPNHILANIKRTRPRPSSSQFDGVDQDRVRLGGKATLLVGSYWDRLPPVGGTIPSVGEFSGAHPATGVNSASA